MNVLIAVDFSAVTEAMLATVAKHGWARGEDDAHLYLVHVAEPNPDFVGWEAGPVVVRDQMAEEFHREHAELARLAEVLREAGAEQVTPLLVQGPTVSTVLAQIKKLDAGLVVVGTHGHGATYDLIVGSVSSGIIRKSSVPVLVVPSPQDG